MQESREAEGGEGGLKWWQVHQTFVWPAEIFGAAAENDDDDGMQQQHMLTYTNHAAAAAAAAAADDDDDDGMHTVEHAHTKKYRSTAASAAAARCCLLLLLLLLTCTYAHVRTRSSMQASTLLEVPTRLLVASRAADRSTASPGLTAATAWSRMSRTW